MKRFVLAFVFLFASLRAADFPGFAPIGAVASIQRDQTGIIISCQDQSQVRIDVLAPDVVRVQAAFRKPLSPQQSWAVVKTSWPVPQWKLSEETDAIVLSTGELETVVQRSPLLVSFRDPKTHRTINADARPMMHDPKTNSVAAAKKLGFDEHFYGLGEKAAHLDKRRGLFTMWNTDTFGYKEGTDPIYQSIPFYLGWQSGAAYGIFYDNSDRTHFDLGSTTQLYAAFLAEGGPMDYYFFRGPSMKKVLGRYTDLTGHMPLPPLWALGNHQSRYSYYPDTVVEQVAERYRADDLPLDAIHLDIHYMNEYRTFTWDPERFPDPKALAGRLRNQGVRLVTILDPGVKFQPPAPGAAEPSAHPELGAQDKTYYVFNQGKAGDYFLKRKDGRLYIAKVWPGESVFVDYTKDAAAEWWGGLFRAYTDNGVAGIWTDMNEPSDFNDQTGASQADVVTYDRGTYSLFGKDRNLFALHMTRSTYEGLARLRPAERPFVITRAGYSGIQRYAAAWTGDIPSTWDSMALTIPMFQSLGLSGEAMVGADVGGFIGRADGELLTRWYQIGFLTPFLRNHAGLDSYDHEPWRFGTYYEDIIRSYLKLRYRLLPYLYTALEQAHRTGIPAFRPLVLNFQDDANTLDLDDEFMAGDDLLVAPVLERGTISRSVYLPRGTWYDYWSGREYQGGQRIRVEAPLERVPLFVRGGAVLPVGPEKNHVADKLSDPVTFQIYPDANGQAAGTLYEDDGISPAYRHGVFCRTAVTASRLGEALDVQVAAAEGSYRPPARDFILEAKGRQAVRVPEDGQAHRVTIR